MENDAQLPVVIPISEKDADNLQKNLPFFLKYLPCDTLTVIGSAKVGERFGGDPRVRFVCEDSLYEGMTFARIKTILEQRDPGAGRRTGWYFQQFLKMAYALCCEAKAYLVWDGDTLPLRKLTFEENGKYLFNLKEEYHLPYFATMQKLIGGGGHA